MNRMNKRRLAGIGLVLLLPLVLNACFGSCESCERSCEHLAPPAYYMCIGRCIPPLLCWPPVFGEQACTENPDECAATLEQMQTAAIQYCEEYPDECQQYFDSWVESLDKEEDSK